MRIVKRIKYQKIVALKNIRILILGHIIYLTNIVDSIFFKYI